MTNNSTICYISGNDRWGFCEHSNAHTASVEGLEPSCPTISFQEGLSFIALLHCTCCGFFCRTDVYQKLVTFGTDYGKGGTDVQVNTNARYLEIILNHLQLVGMLASFAVRFRAPELFLQWWIWRVVFSSVICVVIRNSVHSVWKAFTSMWTYFAFQTDFFLMLVSLLLFHYFSWKDPALCISNLGALGP